MLDLAIGSPGVYDVGFLQPFVDALPPAEHPGAMVLIFNLVQISRLVDDFGAAVALLDYVEKSAADVNAVSPGTSKPIEIARVVHVLRLWNGMAGRDAAMTVFHFGKTLAAIRSGLNSLPSIIDDVEHTRLRAAAKRFRQDFPNFEKTRNGTGHRAELTASVNSLSEHLAGGEFIFDGLEDRTYTITYEGSHRTLVIDHQTRGNLAETANEVFAAFPKISANLPPLNLSKASPN
ncbi:hypothetical protein V1279_007611 [Bradyrhizobium sp. AZCC 1610]|uniref:hypothetical protein n=1 Tax=Bradyrhizobium sp. AZCC 1610 TaxID=3117020 RepID=UPI002FF3C9E4